MWSSSVNGPVAQWIRHRPTEPGIAGSSPAGVNCIGKSAKKKPCRRACRVEKVVPCGLEPQTLRLLAVRSNQLSYETLVCKRESKRKLAGRDCGAAVWFIERSVAKRRLLVSPSG